MKIFSNVMFFVGMMIIFCEIYGFLHSFNALNKAKKNYYIIQTQVSLEQLGYCVDNSDE